MAGDARVRMEVVPTDRMPPDLSRRLVAFCERAFEEDLEPYFRAYAIDAHAVVRENGTILAHALWGLRWLAPGAREPLRTAYVEMVAVAAEHRGRGLGTLLMRTVADAIRSYELGALSPVAPGLYERLGWERWLGPLAIRTPGGLRPTPDDRVMVLRLPGTPPLDPRAPLTAEWRAGELW